MSEIKWIKIAVAMFEDEKVDYIESLPDADALLVIWVKLLTLAGKTNQGGYILLSDTLAYNAEMLAHKFRRPLNTVKMALGVFQSLGMLEVDEKKRIAIVNWEKHQNIDGMAKVREQTRQRVQAYREKRKLLPCNVTVTECNGEVTQQKEEVEREQEEEFTSTTTTCAGADLKNPQDPPELPEEQELRQPYGFYQKVFLFKQEYNELVGYAASTALVSQAIEDLDANIAEGKVKGLEEENHYPKLRKYIDYRRKNPDKFIEGCGRGSPQRGKAKVDVSKLNYD